MMMVTHMIIAKVLLLRFSYDSVYLQTNMVAG